jgi:hypothetical protein
VNQEYRVNLRGSVREEEADIFSLWTVVSVNKTGKKEKKSLLVSNDK